MSKKNFLGIPVKGDIIRGEKREEQWPLEQLAPLMQAVLDHPDVLRFGWEQYTPYFNDGDPCVFSVGAVWADPVGSFGPTTLSEDEDDYYEGSHDEVSYDERWGKRETTYNHSLPYRDPNRKIRGAYTGSYQSAYDALMELSDAFESGHFEDVLLEAFGDHAQVVVHKNKITVDEYSHD